MRVAVIGAGMAGLACAGVLTEQGHAVRLFDKGRGPGGRLSTHRVELDGVQAGFDHGAQYLTARDLGFVAQVERWERDGVVARWPAAGDDAWVGTPGMSAPVRALAGMHDVRWGVRVESLVWDGERWRLAGTGEDAPFEAVVVATPAEQAASLLAPAPALSRTAAASRTAPCWTLMAAFPSRITPLPDVLRDLGAIGWAARDSAKSGRAPGERWVVQAGVDWSTEHLEDAAETAAPALLALFAAETGVEVPRPVHIQAHRWRYARSRPAKPAAGALWDAEARIGACGDWLLAPRVEAAWLSGRRLAALIADTTPAGENVGAPERFG